MEALLRATYLERPSEAVAQHHLDRMMAVFEVSRPPLDLRSAFPPAPAHAPGPGLDEIDDDVIDLDLDTDDQLIELDAPIVLDRAVEPAAPIVVDALATTAG